MFGFIKALRGICETKPLGRELWELEGDRIRVKLNQMPEPLEIGAAIYLEDADLTYPVLIVRKDSDTYLAFANRCAHSHRKLDPVPGQQVIRCCSVMHSTYDYEGNKLSGPATGNLIRYQAEVSGDDLMITVGG
jgi:nitrite reductase/ring-hydroxylating ferredoxin subunit